MILGVPQDGRNLTTYDAPFAARLTAVSVSGGVYTYSFVEQEVSPADVYVAADLARRGVAQEINNRSLAITSPGQLVRMYFRTTLGGGEEYEFDAGLGTSHFVLATSDTGGVVHINGTGCFVWAALAIAYKCTTGTEFDQVEFDDVYIIDIDNTLSGGCTYIAMQIGVTPSGIAGVTANARLYKIGRSQNSIFVGSGGTGLFSGQTQSIHADEPLEFYTSVNGTTLRVVDAGFLTSGVVNTTSQSFSGDKTFNGNIIANTTVAFGYVHQFNDGLPFARIGAARGTTPYVSLDSGATNLAGTSNSTTSLIAKTADPDDPTWPGWSFCILANTTGPVGGASTLNAAYCVGTSKGQAGTDPVGNQFVGGICTTVGSTTFTTGGSGGTTGLTLTGTTTLILGGTLDAGNGGTGLATSGTTAGLALVSDGAGGWALRPGGTSPDDQANVIASNVFGN